MSNYYASRGVVPRGTAEPQTTFREEELIRMASRTGNVITDNRAGYGSNRSAVQQGTRTRIGSRGPRIPQQRLSTAETRRNSSLSSQSSGGRRSPKSLEQLDSGLGSMEYHKAPKRSSNTRYKPRGFSTDSEGEDDVIERDHHSSTTAVYDVYQSRYTSTMPVYPSKSAPVSSTPAPTMIYPKHYTTNIRKNSTELMDTTSTAAVPNSPTFDAHQYQKHLLDIQKQAVEQDRLQQGLSLLLPNNDGDTGMHLAIIHSQPEMIYRLTDLITKYPQLRNTVDDQNSLYQTPLHLAVHLQQVDVIKQLLLVGASPFLQDHKGNTPLHIASSLPNTKSLEELLKHMSQANIIKAAAIRNYEGWTCTHTAVLSNNKEALVRLYTADVDMEMKDYRSGRTPLHLAVEIGSFQLVELLIRSCKVNFNTTTFSGCTPLHIAAGRGQMELVAYLISLGADPFIMTDEGDMPYDLGTDTNIRNFLNSVAEVYHNHSLTN